MIFRLPRLNNSERFCLQRPYATVPSRTPRRSIAPDILHALALFPKAAQVDDGIKMANSFLSGCDCTPFLDGV